MSLDDVAAPPYVLAFRHGVTRVERDGEPVLQWRSRTLSLRAASRPVLGVIEALSSGGASEQDLVLRARDDGVTGQARVHYYLDRFKRLAMLTYTATSNGRALATLIPNWTSGAAHLAMPGEVARDAQYVLSRFACLRREDTRFVVESPLGHAMTQIFDARVAALCHLLAEPRTIEELCREIPSLSPEATAMLLGLLLGGGAAGASGCVDEAKERSLETWSFHDLLFHARSRMGRHAEPSGATFPFKDRLDPLPAVKPRMAGPVITLHRPDIPALVLDDVPFTRVLEERRSLRSHGKKPVTVDQIGELLYRSARVRALHDPSKVRPYPHTSRPYPGSGACYELEVYLAVSECDGLTPGLYHYDPLDHELTRISAMSPAVAALITDARLASGNLGGRVHTLLVFAARFQRLSWKYESLVYALLLKDVGALYQTMYLVATAMGLAPCGLDGGNSDLFAEAAGLDYYEETSVGEFLLGSRPAD